jgi:RNA polymerase sigma-70 factor (ECF subfamily)
MVVDRARRIVGLEGPAELARSDLLTFEGLFQAEHQALFRALYLIVGNTQEAEELMQDAFLKVWERWDRVSRMDNPAGYLCRIAVNGARSRIRRLRLAARRSIAPPGMQLPDPFADVDLRDELVRAFAALSERQRMALVLTDLLDVSAEDSARLLRVKPSTVRSLASQARAALKVRLGAEHA